MEYGVVHQISGRVRFRIPSLAHDPQLAENLQNLLENEDYVTSVRIKPCAGSVVVNYQSESLSHDKVCSYLENLIQISDTVFPKKIHNKTLNSPTEETADWSELKLSAVATVLASLKELVKVPIPGGIIATSVMAASWPVTKRAAQSLWAKGKLNIDCLDVIALTFCCVQGGWLTPALLLLLHEFGDYIRDRTARTSAQQAADLLSTLGHFAWVDRNGKQQIPIDQVEIGDIVIVYPGEQISVDGQIIKGKASIDQQKLTGESMPVVREVGETVYATTLVRSGEIYIKAERIGNQTRAGLSLALVKQAPVHDTRMANYAAQIAEKAVLPALMFAGGILAVTRQPSRVASILTLDFVTGIRVSVPTTFLGALNHAVRHGVLIRSGRALEKLSQVDTLVFDKTGTLTQGDLQVVGIDTVNSRSRERLLQLAASVEQRLTHPLADTIARYASAHNIPILPRGEWNYEVGLGIWADIDGERVLVGSARFLERSGVSLDCFYEQHPCLRDDCGHHSDCPISVDKSLIYVASNGQFQGVIQYADPLRQETPQVIQTLQNDYEMGVYLLTGDNQTRANAVATTLDIPFSQVYAESFPEQKAEVIRQLHAQGKTVGYVGDGLNDSVALAYADVSISFGDGSEIARETADVVLMNNNLRDLLEAISIARQTRQLIRQNIGLSVVPNVAALSLASTVGLHPLLATVVHNGSAIAAGINGLRPLIQHSLEPVKA